MPVCCYVYFITPRCCLNMTLEQIQAEGHLVLWRIDIRLRFWLLCRSVLNPNHHLAGLVELPLNDTPGEQQ